MAGIFVGAKISRESSKLIQQYVKSLDLPADAKPMPVGEYHATIIYSHTPLPIEYPLDKSPAIANAYDIRYIGAALALIIESPWLRWRLRLAKLCGYRSDYPGFIPHISLVMDPPPGLPVAWYLRPAFQILLQGEYQEEAKD